MDGYLDGSSEGYAGRIEVIEGRTGRRYRSEAERARIAAESLVPGAKVADVARRHGATRWQVYDWRRKLGAGQLAVPEAAMAEPAFAALVVEPPQADEKPVHRAPKARAPGRIELVIDGITVRVGADVDEAQLVRVIRAVRADRIKVLIWDRTGMVLVNKRLEGAKFVWPQVQDGVMKMSPAQFSALFEGLDWRLVRPERVRRPELAG